MKCQIFFSRKNKKNITSLLSAESAHSMVSVKSEALICIIIRVMGSCLFLNVFEE